MYFWEKWNSRCISSDYPREYTHMTFQWRLYYMSFLWKFSFHFPKFQPLAKHLLLSERWFSIFIVQNFYSDFSLFKFNSFPNSLSLFYVEKNFLIFRQLITHEKYNILINYEATIRKQNLVKQKVSCSWKNLQMLRSLVKTQFRNWKTLKFVHVQLFYSCSWYWLFI